MDVCGWMCGIRAKTTNTRSLAKLMKRKKRDLMSDVVLRLPSITTALVV